MDLGSWGKVSGLLALGGVAAGATRDLLKSRTSVPPAAVAQPEQLLQIPDRDYSTITSIDDVTSQENWADLVTRLLSKQAETSKAAVNAAARLIARGLANKAVKAAVDQLVAPRRQEIEDLYETSFKEFDISTPPMSPPRTLIDRSGALVVNDADI